MKNDSDEDDDRNWYYSLENIVYLDGMFVPISKIVAVSDVDIDDSYLKDVEPEKVHTVVDELYSRKKPKRLKDGSEEVPFYLSVYIGHDIHLDFDDEARSINLYRGTMKAAQKEHKELLFRLDKYYQRLSSNKEGKRSK